MTSYDNICDIYWAMKNGYLEYLQYLTKKGVGLRNYRQREAGYIPALCICVENGRLDILKYCNDNIDQISTTRDDLVAAAAKFGHFALVKYLLSIRKYVSRYAMEVAAEKGYLEILQLLHDNRQRGCTTRVMDKAAENGHLHIVKWLHENRSEGCTIDAMDWAARNGHLEVVKWLHQNRSEGCTVDAMDWAAMNGHLEVVK